MFDTWKRKRALARIEAGDGSALQRFRWWQLPGRALFHLQPSDSESTYSVDVRHWQNQGSGEVRANLYRNGRHTAASKLPAAFPVAGGTIEVAMSGFGIKRCHYVSVDGKEQQLRPDPSSAEGHRARFDHNHPLVSRLVGVISVAMLLVGIALLLLHVGERLSQIPPVADSVGTFVSPLDLPLWLTIALTIAAALASIERALRLRYHWLLDAAAN